ncbi:MAG: NADH-quinone oxidoreductase subunit NuoG [Spirochaetia bacterium]|jgi:NADH-quinone oxidoreductase subunit G
MKTFTLTIDGQRYEVEGEGKNLLAVSLSLGLNLPYFCWHPALHSVGACRQCAVKLFKDESDTRGRIVMSCMTPVADGMRVSIEDPEARAFRGSITEWLMVNHPHDCPICDEGGECHLQDMTVMTGHTYRSYRFTKRTYRNQNLGPFLNHEMNRCIQCYRCIRFYRDYAGGKDLEVLGAHDNVYFGRHADGTLESEFSGNLVEVCPTGVFTDKTLKKHYTRKWDLQTAPSICVHCAVGCNIIPGERYGTLRRVRTRFNGEVNGYFLCDRGRYGYEFVNSPRRIRQALAAKDGALAPVPAESALSLARESLGAGKAVGIGSPRASLETNYALRRLVGAENFFMGISDSRLSLHQLMLKVLKDGPAPSASVRQAGASDAVLVLGEDVWNTAPILALNLRQASTNTPAAAAIKKQKLNRWDDSAVREAIRHEKGPFFVASVEETRLDEVAKAAYHAAPADIARLGFAVAREIDPKAPAVSGLAPDVQELAARIGRALLGAERPLVVSGAGLGSAEVIQAAANVARALMTAGRDARISLVFPEANSFGAAMLARGGIESAARALGARKGAHGAEKVALLVAEADLFREADARTVSPMLAAASCVIAIDHSTNATTEAAQIVLPAATYAESSGTLVSSEGRAQRFFSVMPPIGDMRESWHWLGELAAGARGGAGNGAPAWQNLDAIIDAMVAEFPELRGVREAAPNAAFRINGLRVPRKSIRESGRTAVTANIELHEPRPAQDPDSALSYTMEGLGRGAPPALFARFWSPGWNSDQSLNKFQSEVGGQLVGGDPGVRLVEAPSKSAGSYFAAIPAAPAARDGLLLLVPRYHVFGSEELSILSPGVAERSPNAYIALSRSEAESRGLADGQTARVTTEEGAMMDLTVVIRQLPAGVAAAPWGRSGLTGTQLPARVRIAGGGT